MQQQNRQVGSALHTCCHMDASQPTSRGRDSSTLPVYTKRTRLVLQLRCGVSCLGLNSATCMYSIQVACATHSHCASPQPVNHSGLLIKPLPQCTCSVHSTVLQPPRPYAASPQISFNQRTQTRTMCNTAQHMLCHCPAPAQACTRLHTVTARAWPGVKTTQVLSGATYRNQL